MRGEYSVVQVRPHGWVPRCGQCRWLQSSLRVPPARGPGPHGAGPRQKRRSGGVNQGGRPRCRVRAAGQTQDAASRLAAGQEELFMPPAQAAGAGGLAGDLCRQRISLQRSQWPQRALDPRCPGRGVCPASGPGQRPAGRRLAGPPRVVAEARPGCFPRPPRVAAPCSRPVPAPATSPAKRSPPIGQITRLRARFAGNVVRTAGAAAYRVGLITPERGRVRSQAGGNHDCPARLWV